MQDFDSGDYHEKFSDYYVYKGTLGRGAFAVVVHAVDRQTGEEVAVKILPKKRMKRGHIMQLRTEAEILASLNHSNIIQFKNLKETRTRVLIGMEVVHGENLKEFMKKNKITPDLARQMITSILTAVNYLHSQNVIHRDLKPENILVEETSFAVKIADFGLSAQHKCAYKHPMDNDRCGTLMFMAPEQRQGDYYSKAVDVWSCGIILYMLLNDGQHPIACDTDTPETYLKKTESFKWQFPPHFPDAACQLILRMTEPLPIERYTASLALQHPWVCRQPSMALLTPFEELEQYNDEIKLKNLVMTLFFSTLFQRPPRIKRSPSKKLSLQLTQPKRLGNFMAATKSWQARVHTTRRIVFTSKKRLPSSRQLVMPKLPENCSPRPPLTAVNSKRHFKF